MFCDIGSAKWHTLIFQVLDYYDIVKNPISLCDIKVKVEDGQYETPQEFVDDMALLLDNADLYSKVSVLHEMFYWSK